MELIGRHKELTLLAKVKSSRRAEFIAVYGRRRVGKTYLVRTAFENKFDFTVTGLANATLTQQLANFHYAIAATRNTSFPPPANWLEAFRLLISILEA